MPAPAHSTAVSDPGEALRPPRRTARALVVVYSVAVFANASLLFSVEPMFAKLALPLLGGTPSVWNTALVFFQAALLVGYAYAHFTTRHLRVRQQVVVHLGLVVLSCISLPLQIRAPGDPPAGGAAILWLVVVLAASLGLPFAVLASGAPLLQRWFAATGHPDADDPYFLYAASNLGSLCALLSYPFLIEPWFGLSTQRSAWSIGYVGVMSVVGACAWGVRNRHARDPVLAPPVSATDVANVSGRRRAGWILYAAVPSSLLMGATTYVSTDVAAVPLLWVLPLALYLLTFVLAFAAHPPISHGLLVRIEPHFLIVAAILLFLGVALPGPISAVFHFALLFVVGMVCHGELVRRRPPPALLTEFYLWISVGGLVGGVFNALVAPIVFSSVLEYPIAIVLAGFLRPIVSAGVTKDAPGRARILDLALPVALGIGLVAPTTMVSGDPSSGRLLPVILGSATAVLLLSASSRPVRFGLALAAVFAAARTRPGAESDSALLRAERSFFGVYRVLQAPRATVRTLVHGTTVHGAQATDPARRLDPLTYYHRAGPIGDLFGIVPAANAVGRQVGLVGLGIGSLACYGRPGERWTYYEIDPVVLEIARDPRLFTFLRDCAPRVDVVLGDARLTLGKAPTAAYDVLVLDAFSSDAIPVHLLTREAFALYRRVLAPHGVLAVHISNRHLNLEPIVSGLAQHAGLTARVRRDVNVSPAEHAATGRSAAIWVLLADAPEDLGPLASDARWAALQKSGDVWTDDFSNVLSVLTWR